MRQVLTSASPPMSSPGLICAMHHRDQIIQQHGCSSAGPVRLSYCQGDCGASTSMYEPFLGIPTPHRESPGWGVIRDVIASGAHGGWADGVEPGRGLWAPEGNPNDHLERARVRPVGSKHLGHCLY
jgi:hypothetical protein